MSGDKDKAFPIPELIPSEALTGPAGPFPTATEVLSAVKTFRQHGTPTLLQTIRGIARSMIGEHEMDGNNWGPIVQKVATPFLSATRLATFAPGQRNAGKLAWCSLFVSYCVLEGLKADGRPPEQLAEWRRVASSEVSVLHERMRAAGLIAPFVPGEPPPEDTIVVFFRKLAHVEIYDGSTNILVVSIGGNSGPKANQVYENKHPNTDARIDCWGRLPW